MTAIVLPFDQSPSSDVELIQALQPVFRLVSHVGMVKLGLEAMTAPLWVSGLETSVGIYARGMLETSQVLWDQKIADIGNTAKNTLRNLIGRVGAVTLHASMSGNALSEAGKLLAEANARSKEQTTFFGVTVLTDIDEKECLSIFGDTPNQKVLDFAHRLLDSGVNGMVCSGKELQYLRDKGIVGLKTLVPGIRPAWAETGDQKRIVTPADAARLGADYIVVGRPIMEADDPIGATKRILEEVASAS